jgi:predicted aspartyl protease
MSDDMGTFRITVEIANPEDPHEQRRSINDVLVDTGAEYSVFPATVLDELGVVRRRQTTFRQADGSSFTRWMGDIRLYAGGTVAIDHIVFGEPHDILLLGAHGLRGLNLRVEPATRRLVDAGPVVAGAMAA